MGAPRSAWGIEIGANAIKAIRLERDGDQITVSDFAYIPHKKVLTTPDLDQDEMVRLSLGQFISQKSLEGEHLVMSVPGHAAFARFAKLPPVEPKKVPDIVKFEAVQQIPFPIDEVEWDYQTFTADDSPEVEVGIFAITRDRVQQTLGLYNELGVSPEALTLSPVAVYNALAYDLSLDKNAKPVIFLDIGTQATDVVIAEQGRCWIRTFPLGGTHFTEAIASAFKLSYSKAEKLKREASTSKYAKQIMQAMRPVFTDLLQDLQRSIGYYQSVHRDYELTNMVGIGSTFKIPGLRKFIGQQLQVNVARLDEYRKIAVTGRNAASFAEHAVNMASAYGLALQGVGLAPIDANLVPVNALREQMWHAKTKWFAAAAAIIVVGAASQLYHPLMAQRGLLSTPPTEVSTVLKHGEKLRKDLDTAKASDDVGFRAENMRRLLDDREIWPHVLNDATSALLSTDPQRELLTSAAELTEKIPVKEWRLVRMTKLAGDYIAPEGSGPRRIAVTLDVELSHDLPIEFVNTTVAQWLRDNAEPEGDRAEVPYRILVDSVTCNPNLLEKTKIASDGSETSEGGGGSSSKKGKRPSTPQRPTGGPSSSGPSTGPSAGGTSGRRSSPGAGGRRPPGGRGPSLGGGEGRRRSGGGGGRTPPGGAMGGGSPSLPGRGPAGRGPSGSDPGAERPTSPTRTSPELDKLAPVPERPSRFPAGSTYYRVPITFEIELLPPSREQGGEATAAAASGEDRS